MKLLSKSRSSWWDKVAALYDHTYDKVSSQLGLIYQSTQKKIIYDMLTVYNEIMKPGATPTVNNLYQYNRYYKMVNDINIKLRELGLQEIKITQQSLIDLYKANTELIGEQLAFTPVFTDEQIVRSVNSIWCQDGKLWSDRVWEDKNLLQSKMTEAMVDGVARGKSPDWLTKQLMEATGGSYNNTQRLLITELAHIQNQASLDSYKQGGVNAYKVLHEPDACEICTELGQNSFDVNKAPVIPAHPRCRCCTLAIIDGEVVNVQD